VSNIVDLKALAKLSKPVTKLIESIEKAVGAWWEPHGMRRRAQAEVDVMRIRAEGKLELLELADRASQRLAEQELRRQANIEAVIRKAVPELPETVSEEPVDTDWMAQFFEQCQDFSNEQMQSLWARILAGEVAKPGSYSPMTLHTVKLLRKADAEVFTRFCTYVVNFGGSLASPHENELMQYESAHGTPYGHILHLQALGLLETGFGLGIPIPAGGATIAIYNEVPYVIRPATEGPAVRIAVRALTQVGIELARICGARPDPEYWNKVMAVWREQRQLTVDRIPVVPTESS
jgi:hypothetical protein